MILCIHPQFQVDFMKYFICSISVQIHIPISSHFHKQKEPSRRDGQISAALAEVIQRSHLKQSQHSRFDTLLSPDTDTQGGFQRDFQTNLHPTLEPDVAQMQKQASKNSDSIY